MRMCTIRPVLRQSSLVLSAMGALLGVASCGNNPTIPGNGNDPVDLTHNNIAFITDGNVASMQEDGSNRAMLTSDSFNLEFFGIFSPLLWSPDGTRLAALLRPAPLDEELVIVAADGSGYQFLASGFGNWGLALGGWSPDGNRIAYSKANQAHAVDWRIYIVGVADGVGRPLTTDSIPWRPQTYNDMAPVWSPDGEEIIFTSNRPTESSPRYSWHLFSAKAGGSVGRQLSTLEMAGWALAPDGRHIAFVQSVGSFYGAILLLDLADGSTTRLSTGDDVDGYPEWSPDGSRLVFISIRDGNKELYVMGADGSGVHRLTTDAAEETSPSWSPDGTRLAFQTNRDGNWEIYTVGVDGTGLTNLTRSPGHEFGPAWRP